MLEVSSEAVATTVLSCWVAVLLLVKTGIVTVKQLREARRYVIVGAFVVAAVVTPPDVVRVPWPMLVVPSKKFKKAQTVLERAGEKGYTVGRIVKGDRKVLYT